MRILYTVGHSTHSIEHFISLLVKHEIQVIADVRSSPYSLRNPQFNREPLQKKLRAAGIAYVFLGKELGARSDNPACYINGKVQYNYVVDEPSFREGLGRLRVGMEQFRVALMCAERDPLTCHRTILVCRELRESGLEINHILADGAVETNRDAERRLMSIVNVHPDMLAHESDCIEQAYEMQANNIAYVIPQRKPDSEQSGVLDEDLHDRLYE